LKSPFAAANTAGKYCSFSGRTASRMFRMKLGKKSGVVINQKEHKQFKWASPEDALKMSLIPDADETIRLFYSI